jgi:N6-adenosine-specific RNA methylase IME4
MTWPFGSLKMFGYSAILADPPWYFRNFSAKGEIKNPVAHYACMSTADIAALPVSQLAAPDCALLMWATAPMLPDAIDLMRAWGFTFKSAGAWAKQSSTGNAWAFGTGYCFRSAAEFFLLGTLGKPKVRSRSVRNLIVAPVREHSRKPEDQYAMVEQLFAGPYAEVFSRANRAGWDSFGDETGKFA